MVCSRAVCSNGLTRAVATVPFERGFTTRCGDASLAAAEAGLCDMARREGQGVCSALGTRLLASKAIACSTRNKNRSQHSNCWNANVSHPLIRGGVFWKFR